MIVSFLVITYKIVLISLVRDKTFRFKFRQHLLNLIFEQKNKFLRKFLKSHIILEYSITKNFFLICLNKSLTSNE